MSKSKSNSKTIVLTGGCGFIGHHFAEHVHENTDWNIIIIDKQIISYEIYLITSLFIFELIN